MAKARKTDQFLGNLLDALHAKLPGDWELEKGPSWRLVRRNDWGYDGIRPETNFKYLPAMSVQLMYGVKHEVLHSLLKKLGCAWDDLDTFQFYKCMPEVSMISDYNTVNFTDLVDELLGGEKASRLLVSLNTFFDLRNIRDAMEGPNPAFEPNVANMVAIDVALDDLVHLRAYHDSLSKRHKGREEIVQSLELLQIPWV